MRGRVSRYRIKLNARQRQRLEAVIRRRKPQHWLVSRAKIILLAHGGLRICEICRALTLDHQVVRRWIKRYLDKRYDGLKDRVRSGRPAEIEPKVWQKIVTLVVQPPEKFGLPLARWSVRALSEFVAQRYGWRIGRTTISRFLRSMALKPHRVRYWLNPSDPDFDEKAGEICSLYLAPPPKTTVLSIDEKPGIQALRRKHATRGMTFGRPRKVEFEYERKGTRNVFAAFNIKTGHVFAWVTPNRSLPYVMDFLDQILRFYRSGPIVIITDNINTRTGNAAREWLDRHPRVRFVYTPKHGSWLNQVEIWFGILTSQLLRHQSFNSVRALAAAIYRFTRHWNEAKAKPFNWTYTGRVLQV